MPRHAARVRSGLRCYLGSFEAIDKVQAEAMKKAVDEHGLPLGTDGGLDTDHLRAKGRSI